MSVKIENEYFNWLCDMVADKTTKRNYISLLRHLYETPYRWDIWTDENRASDGLDMRLKFADDMRYSPDEVLYSLAEPCSVFEMLVALSCRLGDIMEDDISRTSHWFWVMMDNLGLRGMNEVNYEGTHVYSVLERFMNHKYNFDGTNGGLFSVENPRQDFRETDIWYQANWYLSSLEDFNG